MALGEGMSCVKYLLFCFNLLFAVTGLIILIVGGIVEYNSNLHDLINLTKDDFYQLAPVVLMIVGVIIFVVAFFGCCGAVKENHCMVVTFSVFLIIIFLAELAVGIAGYVKHKDLETTMQKTLNSSITDYPTNPETKRIVDMIQTDLKCCGVYGYTDWTTNNIAIPASCCSEGQILTDGKVAECTPTSETFQRQPCLGLLLDNANLITLILGGVGIGIALVQLIGVMFACCLARSIRSQYETV